MLTNLMNAISAGVLLLFVLLLMWSARPALPALFVLFVVAYIVIKAVRLSLPSRSKH